MSYFDDQHGNSYKEKIKKIFKLHVVFQKNENFFFIFDTFIMTSFATFLQDFTLWC